MSKWNVSEQSIYNENGQLIIEASEWYMRENLQKICDEHNSNETLKALDKSINDNTYLESLREIDTHVRSTKEPIPYIIETLKSVLPEYQN